MWGVDIIEDDRDPGRSLTLDERYFPLLISTWIGEPTLEMVDRYFAWNTVALIRARTEGMMAAVVIDALDAGLPDSSVLQVVAARSLDIEDDAERYSIGQGYVALRSKLVRGALTAIRWVNPNVGIHPMKSMEAALAAALRELRERGHPMPVRVPEVYERPRAQTVVGA